MTEDSSWLVRVVLAHQQSTNTPSSIITSSSAIAERLRDARVTLIRKIVKWNFLIHPFGA